MRRLIIGIFLLAAIYTILSLIIKIHKGKARCRKDVERQRKSTAIESYFDENCFWKRVPGEGWIAFGHKSRYKETECWTTKCRKCGRQFLSSREKSIYKLLARCSGCGCELIWDIPYTRVEVETSDGKILVCKNIVHRLDWVGEMEELVINSLDESADVVKVEIGKSGTKSSESE